MEKHVMMKKLVLPVAVVGAAALWTLYKYLQSTKRRMTFREKTQQDIHIVNTASEWESIYPVLRERCDVIKAVGFDCEWVFWGHRLPVALIQLATHDGLCVLVRIYQMTDSIPDSLREFLANKSVLKIGVSAKDDGKKLLKDYGMPVNGCIDLRHIQTRVRAFNCGSQSLQGLAAGVLDVAMVKDREIRCGDWEAETLSQEQIEYAAADALVAMDIFMRLVSVKCVGGRGHNFYGSSIPTDEVAFWRTARSLCQGIVDVTFKSTKGSGAMTSDRDPDDAARLSEIQQGLDPDNFMKPGRFKNHQKAFMTRKRPLYYNCRLLSPDGQCLTTCDIRKAEWYLKKGLGHKVDDEPLTVQLNFEPVNRPTSDRDYYLQDKENVCVVCGVDSEYIRKLIVPQEYRKYFPSILKDHSSHDVLLLCINCHLRSANYDMVLRQRFAVECDAPMSSGKDSKNTQDQDLQQVVSAARALLKSRLKIPESRVHQLEGTIKNYYGVQTISEDLLQSAAEIDYKVHNSSYVPHGKKVVEFYMKKEGGLLEFEKLWRRQFVETMEPKYLPALWSIEHKPERMQPLSD